MTNLGLLSDANLDEIMSALDYENTTELSADKEDLKVALQFVLKKKGLALTFRKPTAMMIMKGLHAMTRKVVEDGDVEVIYKAMLPNLEEMP